MYCPTPLIDLVNMIEVAVAVFQKDNLFLMQQRPSGKPYAGYWEFPGGKLESNESALDALKRECLEELSVEINNATFLFDVTHHYPDNDYKLYIYKVVDWQGTFINRENQIHAWFAPDQFPKQMLNANHDIVNKLLTHATS